MKKLITISIYPFLRTMSICQGDSEVVKLTYDSVSDYWDSFTLLGVDYDFQLDYRLTGNPQDHIKVYKNTGNNIDLNKPLKNVWVKIII